MSNRQLKIAEHSNKAQEPLDSGVGYEVVTDRKAIKLAGSFFLLAALAYLVLFIQTASGPWFNPGVTNDDAQQQLFPFHKALDSELFAGDLITKCMEGYLPPLHYGLSYAITLLTQNPVMTGHWVMFIQFTLGLLFIFGTVRAVAGFYPAIFTVVWYVHARPLWARMVGGLPRGWLGTLLLAYLYLASTNRLRGVLALVVVASFLNPPAAFLICVAHSLFLGWSFLFSENRKIWLRQGLIFLVVAGISGFITLQIVKRPPEIGQMVTLEQASRMPAFQVHGGRFAFLPFPSSLSQLSGGGSRAFIQNSRFAPEWIRPFFFPILVGFVGLVIALGRSRRIVAVPPVLLMSLVGVVLTFFLARIFAFKLYVPNRYILVPLNLMWMVIFPVAVWRLSGPRGTNAPTLNRFTSLVCLGLILVGINGFVFRSAPGFDISTQLRSGLYRWMETQTDKQAVFAGHPDSLNGVPLFAKRIVYVNSEVAHPFYLNYYNEIKRRLNISLRLSYARSWPAFLKILNSEKADYFVFTPSDYEERRLAKAKYVQPFSRLVERIARKHSPDEFLFSKIDKKVNPDVFPYVVYSGDDGVVIDLNRLRRLGGPTKVQ